MELSNRHILLGITGGVAAYKSAQFARELQRHGASVQVVMTEAATRFVGPVTFQALTGRRVYTDQWDASIPNNMAHIELSREADVIVIAPTTADFIAKLANGLADDLLSTLCIARACPLLVAPAMNREMWANPATQRNVAQLVADGIELLGPETGDQACGETGMGRMLEPEALLERTIGFFVPKSLQGRRVLITAGPTFEPIDPVRGITNLSSGKMGFAIARACQQAGAQVTLIAGATSLPTPPQVERMNVSTARQMFDAVNRVLADRARTDVFISVAAVADWRVENASESKLKKSADGKPPELQFAENPDILASVAARENAPYCVGFAAESEDLERNAQQKRLRKRVPLLVANIGHATFGRDDNELLLIDEHGTQKLDRASKDALASELTREIAKRLNGTR
jgi:phosphopantothenoylcysteine decarboxylase/phosphopantothenate--cysteine ligase